MESVAAEIRNGFFIFLCTKYFRVRFAQQIMFLKK